MLTATCRITWRGNVFLRQVYRPGMMRNLKLAGTYGRDSVRTDISTPGSYHPPSHSKPGQPPFKITGFLWRSYGFHVMKFPDAGLIVGSDDPVARYLELGTGVHGPYAPGHNKVHIQPRPHLIRLVRVRGNVLARLICAPL